MMLRTIVLTAAVSFASLPGFAGDLSQPYAPTRAEWLQSTLHERITQTTDLLQRRVGVVVAVFPKEQQVSVVIASASGQASPDEKEKAFYVRHIEQVVKATLAAHEWAGDLRVAVTFH